MNVYYETFLMSNEASSIMHQLKNSFWYTKKYCGHIVDLDLLTGHFLRFTLMRKQRPAVNWVE